MEISPCPCRKKQCPRHGDCDACREHHKNSKYKPACERKSLIGRLIKKDKNNGGNSVGA
ncbi:MAG TPA: hypothetical protein VHO66_07460 [Ruminiclostridium sp.]|nr:hypothetical protein [Ruminiclostridium sp.]